VRSCEPCQQNKPSNRQPAGLLQPLEIADQRWEQITMDFIVQLPKTKSKHDAILVVVDRLSKRIHAIPTTTNVTAPEVAQLFFQNIFRLHGLPRIIVSDRDPKFVSNFWKALFKQLGVRLAMSTAHHPQTDGQTERANRTLEDMLRTFVNYKQDNWDKCLPAAEFAYNNSLQASTGFTPFYLDCGQHPIIPSTLTLSKELINTNVAATDDFLQHWQNSLLQAKEALAQAQDRQAHYANKHRRPDVFKTGDRVLLSTTHLNAPTEARRPLKKLQPKFIGPYQVEEVISETAYRLSLPSNLKVHPVFHISRLKRYIPNEFPERTQPLPAPIFVDDSHEPEYEVEEILDKRFVRGRPQYLVLWKGYARHDATWEPRENLANAVEILEAFERK
jgi:transposase InsO family protein